MRELVLETVKQLAWPGLPAEMTAVTGERSWGSGLTTTLLNLFEHFQQLSNSKHTRDRNTVVILHLGNF